MFRKLLSAVTSTAVVAGLVTRGGGGHGDAGGCLVHHSALTSSRRITRHWPVKCGLDFGLVLDSSGSIGSTGIANLKLAANAFVDSLVDTGSKVAVTSFSTESPGLITGGNPGQNLAPTALTTANLPTIKGSYNNLISSGWTNWEDGLFEMQNFFPPVQWGRS